ncbi:phenylalanine--tRNA ligase beta subunit-related protein [Microbacterium sp. JZ70]
MAGTTRIDRILEDSFVHEEVFAIRPDYRAMLVVIEGIAPAAGDAESEALLVRAEEHARRVAAAGPIEDEPHIASWREAYRAFGAKPQRTRNSLEALTRRAADALPRVNRLTDVYNAVSVLHGLPLGGEDLDRYVGAPRLMRATGTEPFDTVAGGDPVVEHPDPGEVVWCDGEGVTCRRWNWRQGRRTRLTDGTRTALFILDALAPTSDAELEAAADALVEHLGAGATVARRLLAGSDSALG